MSEVGTGVAARWLRSLDAAAFDAPGREGAARADRLHEIDGIRGWAALAVVIYHMFYETFGMLYPAFRNPLTETFNGRYAVGIFFILSGEALSASFFAGGGMRAVASLAVKRHSRLSIPIFAAALLVWILQQSGLIFAHEAAGLVHREDWLGTFVSQPISLLTCLQYALIGVYVGDPATGQIVPFLWTMSVEMMGSILIFILLSLWDWLRYRAVILVILGLLLLSSGVACYYAGFVAGLFFASARRQGMIGRIRRWRWMPALSGIAIVALLAAMYASRLRGERFYVMLEVALLAAVFVNPWAVSFFSTRVSRFLGHISFPLYLVHFAVLISFTSGMIVHFGGGAALDQRMAATIASASVAAAIVAAILFEPVELLTRMFGKWLARTIVLPRDRG
ncbi:acyltransferase family protein [Sphingomonas sp.]|uniref:acyltransferase family protein n=1 Tax=Sphingomonas sp. TaxID=28214 RepID=UPI0025EA6D6D|nr:acyltransferase family protein [Sphingomonas sp.]